MDKELNAKEKTCIPHGIQLSWMDLIKKGHITKIEFYSSAFSVRYEEVYETPITQLSQGSLISITPGFRAEHSYTLIIPYDAYQDLGDLPHMVHLKSDENQKTIASWKIDITDSKIDIETPAQMSCNSFRTHLV